jgi:hypothetical protein
VVAGGGAVAGGGLLVKAAVAIFAGALATGISSDRNGPASAAPPSTQRIAAPSWLAAVFPTRGVRAASAPRGARAPAAKTGRAGAKGIGVGSQRAGELGLGPQTRGQTLAQAPAGSAPSATIKSSPLTPVSQVTDQAVSLVGEAQKALEPPVAALPVKVPPVPVVPVPPVEAPKLPGGTPLP